MNGEQRTWSLAILLVCMALVASIAIMAQCSIKTNAAQIEAAECTKHGGAWHPSSDPAQQFCQEHR